MAIAPLSSLLNGDFSISDTTNADFGWTLWGNASVTGGTGLLGEGGTLFAGLSQVFVIPKNANTLRFTITSLNLAANPSGPPDAFEVALLHGATLEPLVGAITGLSNTDALLNIQSDGTTHFASSVSVPGLSQSGQILASNGPLTITVLLDGLDPGTPAALYFDLLGFGATLSGVSIDNITFADEIDTTPPQYLPPAVINSGQNQRSRIDRVELAFSEDVSSSLTLADMELIRHGGDPISLASASLTYNAATNRAALILSSLDLPDGDYTLYVSPDGITDLAGNTLDVDSDGQADGGTGKLIEVSFHRLLGDANGDRLVNGTDLTIVLDSFGQTSTQTGFDPDADLDGNGAVSLADYGIVHHQLGHPVNRLTPSIGSTSLRISRAAPASPSPFRQGAPLQAQSDQDPVLAIQAVLSAGDLDPSFGIGGKRLTDIQTPSDDEAQEVFALPGGKLLLGGFTRRTTTGNDFALVRYNSDGTPDDGTGLDSTPADRFGSGGIVITDLDASEDFAHALALQPDGRILLAGFSYRSATGGDFALVRYDSEGALDDAFAATGQVIADFASEDDRATSILIQPDGKILLGGFVRRETTGNDFALIRYNADGSLDDGTAADTFPADRFGPTGQLTTDLASDAGDVLPVIRVNASATHVGTPITLPSGALLTLASDGSFTYNPNGKFNYLAVNESGSDSFTYAISDSQGQTATATVSLTITGVNDAPVAVNDAYTIYVDRTLAVAAPGVLANDHDPDTSDLLTVSLLSAPAYGQLILLPNGSFTYAPGAACEATADSFTYRLSDGNGGTATASVSITIKRYSGVIPVDGSGILRIPTGGKNDVITYKSGSLLVNRTKVSLAGVADLRIWTDGGNDRIDLSGVTVKASIFAGAGKDTVVGSAASDLVFGGLGNDMITGASGHDLLVGGDGTDSIVASAGNDIIVAGELGCGATAPDLRDLIRRWATTLTISADEENAIASAITDDDYDVLTGSAGSDWFLVDNADRITDLAQAVHDGDKFTYRPRMARPRKGPASKNHGRPS